MMSVERLIASPVGTLRLIADDDALVGVRFDAGEPEKSKEKHAVLDQAERELQEYFEGERTEFTVRLSARGTRFQREVWKALSRVPFGATRSYADIASAVDSPRAVRAVGSANRVNPHAIIVPCHRIIAKDGTLAGYGGGLPNKEWLLAHEARVAKNH
jgi:methylated-DNA-[protein]-cysteine S-methyltransferase